MNKEKRIALLKAQIRIMQSIIDRQELEMNKQKERDRNGPQYN